MPTSFWSMPGLRPRLLALVALCLFPALGLTIYDALYQHQVSVERSQQEARRLASVIAGQQERLMAGVRPLLDSLADNPVVTSGDHEACHTALGELLRDFPTYANIGVV